MPTERQQVVERCRKLINMQQGRGASETEAMFAAKMIGELMDQFDLTMDEITLREEVCETVVFNTGCLNRKPLQYCMVILAKLTDTVFWNEYRYGIKRGVRSKIERKHCFHGMKHDLDMLGYLYEIINRAMTEESRKFKNSREYHNAYIDGMSRRGALASFQHGLSDRIRERLIEMVNDQEKRRQEAMEVAEPNGTGTALVVVKKKIVDESFKTLGIELVHKKLSNVNVYTSMYNKGKERGDSVKLSRGVGGSSEQGKLS